MGNRNDAPTNNNPPNSPPPAEQPRPPNELELMGIAQKIVELIQPLEHGARVRVIGTVATLLGLKDGGSGSKPQRPPATNGQRRS